MVNLLLALVVTGSILGSVTYAKPTGFPTEGPIRFLVIGDTGTGGEGQRVVAKAMKRVCLERGCQFALGLGDNIYEFGPSGLSDIQFQNKFEEPYAELSFPFFMVLGNHDQSGLIPGSGVHPNKGDLEVAYTAVSTKWMMPKRYYQVAFPVTDATDYASGTSQPIVEFFAIDSNPLAPQNMPQYHWYRPHKKYDLEQRAWLRKALTQSKARWKIALQHHPYKNNGSQRNAGQFFGIGLAKGHELKKMVEEEICGRADLLLAGHDHSLQWLKPDPKCGKRPHFIISGAGAKSGGTKSSMTNAAFWEAYQKLGFFWIEANSKQLLIQAYTVSEDGVVKLAFQQTIEAI